MLIHYTNLFREEVNESLEDLEQIGLRPVVGEPGPTELRTSEEIKRFGIVGIYIDVADTETRNGPLVVREAWTEYFAKHPEDED